YSPDKYRVAVQCGCTNLPVLVDRHRGEALYLRLQSFGAELETVHPITVVFLRAESECSQAGDRAGDADREACAAADLVGNAFRQQRAHRRRTGVEFFPVGGSDFRNRSVRRTEPMSRLSCHRTT